MKRLLLRISTNQPSGFGLFLLTRCTSKLSELHQLICSMPHLPLSANCLRRFFSLEPNMDMVTWCQAKKWHISVRFYQYICFQSSLPLYGRNMAKTSWHFFLVPATLPGEQWREGNHSGSGYWEGETLRNKSSIDEDGMEERIFISLRLMPPAFAGLEIASSMARSTTKSSSNNSTILSIASSMARSTTKSNSNSSNNQQQQ